MAHTDDAESLKKLQQTYTALLKKKKKADADLAGLTKSLGNQRTEVEKKTIDMAKVRTQLGMLDNLYKELQRQHDALKERRKEIIAEEQKKTEKLCDDFQTAIDRLHKEIEEGHTARAIPLAENDKIRDEFRRQIKLWETQEKQRAKMLETKEALCKAVEEEEAGEVAKQAACEEEVKRCMDEMERLEVEEKRLRHEIEVCQGKFPGLHEMVAENNAKWVEIKDRIQKMSDIRKDNATTLRGLSKELQTVQMGRKLVETEIRQVEDEVRRVDDQVQALQRQQSALEGLCRVLQSDHEALCALTSALQSAGISVDTPPRPDQDSGAEA
eukprot:comp23323_c0_seq1/m.38402 comp23323_c0_seq1/g.38402  ORF comp23323_c0_seq1/g.38402 comp23323_c0_seq1/m.38402 type:complete len:327 (-) comp23323_c0_seq1:364-1344(-)